MSPPSGSPIPARPLLELIQKRNSCRHYSPRPVPREVVERCLEAARLAPSACNSQPWRFIVVADPGLKAKLADAAFSGVFSMNRFAGQAPVLVVVVTERSQYLARLGGALRGVQYSLIDVGIAVEHLVLQSEELGVGTCWLGWFDEQGVKRVLGLDRGAKVDVMISLGYPEGLPGKEKSRKPASEVWEFRST